MPPRIGYNALDAARIRLLSSAACQKIPSSLQRSLAESQAELARAEERLLTLSEARDAVLEHIADGVLAIAIQNSRLIAQLVERQAQLSQANERLRALSRKLISVQEAERRSLARELYDQVAQSVTGVSLGLAALSRNPSCPPEFAEKLNHYQSIVTPMMKDLHDVVSALRPPALDAGGLVDAVQNRVAALRENHGLDAELVSEGLDGLALPPEYETTLYRLVQEALTNVVRHAGATQVRVRLACCGNTVTAAVEDDGVGFDLAEAPLRGRLGLTGMRERAELIGGRITVVTAPGQGTCITVTAPLDG